MADVIITLKIMPTAPDTDLESISTFVDELVKEFGGEVGKTEEEPVAFGLKALRITFVMDEQKGSTEDLEQQVAKVEGVQSVDVVDVRRAIG